MKPKLHGWFLRKNNDGLLSLSTVKANGCQTAFGNVHNDAFTIAIIVVSKLHAMRASVLIPARVQERAPHRRSSVAPRRSGQARNHLRVQLAYKPVARHRRASACRPPGRASARGAAPFGQAPRSRA